MTDRYFTRVHHVMDPSLEFFSEPELQMLIGHGKRTWPTALLKELIDNALDASEPMKVPKISVTVNDEYFEVSDNGPGIPSTVVEQSLDYTTRISDSLMYISPSRGQLGNALKTVWAAGFVANGDSHIEITGAGTRHDIYVKLDEFGTKPEITHQTEESVHLGTRVHVWWPQAACCLEALNVLRMVYQFSYCDPHAGFVYSEQEIALLSTKITRWHKNKAPSPHWYNKADLQRQIAASQNITLSQLISSFDGLKRTDKRQLINNQFPDIKDAYDSASDMLKLMKANTKAQPPKALGVLGRTTLFIKPSTILRTEVHA